MNTTVQAWVAKSKKDLHRIARKSVGNLAREMTQTQPSVKVTGGAFMVGKVPVDTGELLNSLATSLNGGLIGSGPDSYIAGINVMRLGDTIAMAFTASYARHVEYGTAKMQGRFFVGNAVGQWPQIVATVAKSSAS